MDKKNEDGVAGRKLLRHVIGCSFIGQLTKIQANSPFRFVATIVSLQQLCVLYKNGKSSVTFCNSIFGFERQNADRNKNRVKRCVW